MSFIRRLLLLFYVLAVLVAIIPCAAICLNLIPASTWQKYLNFFIAQPETLAVLAGLAVVSLILLTGIFSRNSNSTSIISGDVHLQQGQPGEVKVTVPAIVGVVETAALTAQGVRAAEASVLRQDNQIPIKVRLTITISQGFSAPAISQAVSSAVNDALLTVLELQNVPVEVKVNEITHAIIERSNRVV